MSDKIDYNSPHELTQQLHREEARAAKLEKLLRRAYDALRMYTVYPGTPWTQLLDELKEELDAAAEAE